MEQTHKKLNQDVAGLEQAVSQMQTSNSNIRKQGRPASGQADAQLRALEQEF